MEREGSADADRGWVLGRIMVSWKTCSEQSVSSKEDKLGVSLFTALRCVLRALGCFCRAEAAAGRSPHKQHPELSKQPGPFHACSRPVKLMLLDTGIVGHLGLDVLADRRV